MKRWTRYLAALLAASLLFVETGGAAALNEAVQATEEIMMQSDEAEYTLENGAKVFFDKETGTITGGSVNNGELLIPAEIDGVAVRSIGVQAFLKNIGITRLEISEGVTEIGDSAFRDCTKLNSVVIPGSVTNIGGNAFGGTFRYGGTVTIGEGVKTIGESAFYNSNVSTLRLPSTLERIENSAFYGCVRLAALSELVLPENLTYIGQTAFAKGTFSSVSIPDGVTEIGVGAFDGCKNLQSVTLPSGLTEIPEDAFYQTALYEVDIPEGVTKIGEYAFAGSDLSRVTIPSTLTAIGDYAFRGCGSLSSITLFDSVTSIGDHAFVDVAEDFCIYGYADTYAEEYARTHNNPLGNPIPFYQLKANVRELTANVLDENGQSLTEGFTITWYDGETEVGTGRTLRGANQNKTYAFTIVLHDELAAQYEQPERQTIAPEDSAERTVRMIPKATRPIMHLTGWVEDENSQPIFGASVTVAVGEGSVSAMTDKDGCFQLDVPQGTASVVIAKDGYYSARQILTQAEEIYDMGSIVLAAAQTASDRIELRAARQRAVESGAAAVAVPLSSLAAMKLTLNGTDGRPVTGFEVQGTTLLLDKDAVRANETVTLTVRDPSGEYADTVTRISLDDKRMGSAELTLLQKGRFVLEGVFGTPANLFVFDQSGACVQTGAAKAGWESDALAAGSYRVALIQKSDLLCGVPSLAYLNDLGLRAGADYLLRDITIADGQIARLEDCAVPALEEGRIAYVTDASVTTNKSSGAVISELVLLRVAYSLDASKGAADSVQIVLPEGIEMLADDADNRVLVDYQSVPYTYDADSRTITVRTAGKSGAVVNLYCAPQWVGEYRIGARLVLASGAVQPLGAAALRVDEAMLEVPEKVGISENLVASGRAARYSKITLYDNGEMVGRATANGAGSWSMEFDLAEPVYQYSYHSIYARIENDSLIEPVMTRTALVTYNQESTELTKITMYNTGDHGAQETVFDFTGSQAAVPYYRMWPSRYPTFTFKAEFGGDASALSDVFVVTTNSAGQETYVEMTYNAASGTWVGVHDYTSFADAPAWVGAVYESTETGTIPCDSQRYEDEIKSYAGAYAAVDSALSEALAQAVSFTNVTDTENSVHATMNIPSPGNPSETIAIGEYSMEVQPAEDIGLTAAPEALAKDGFSSDDGQIWTRAECEDSTFRQESMDLRDGKVLTIEMELNSDLDLEQAALDIAKLASYGDSLMDLLSPVSSVPSLGDLGGLLSGLGLEVWENNKNNRSWLATLEGHLTMLDQNTEYVRAMLGARCADGSLRLPEKAIPSLLAALDAIDAQRAGYETTARNIIRQVGVGTGTCTAVAFPGKALTALTVKFQWVGKVFSALDLTGMMQGWLTDEPVGEYLDETFSDINHQLYELSLLIQQSYQNCPEDGDEDNGEQENRPRPGNQKRRQRTQHIIDPSGYVYEAVPANRLSDVTAAIYNEQGEPWDAADFDQENPQTTGADGVFHWDVPQGKWQVQLTKAGYEPAQTEWLPVPPPQIGISVGMTSTAAPVVTQSNAYTDRIEIVFSQYMNMESVQEAVSLICGETPAEVTVIPLDAENTLDGSTQYAARFAVVPTHGSLTDEAVISVSADAKNYAGKALAAAYQSDLMTVETRPEEIAGADSVSIVIGKTGSTVLTLRPGAAGKTLLVDCRTPAIVQTSNTEIVTDENGAAVVELNGLLPGVGEILITEPCSGLTKTIAVRVTMTEASEEPPVEAVAPVVATLENGTVVTDGMTLPAGTKIMLRTVTEGASIRYTLDDTCPCEENALYYSAPIVLSKTMVLRAAAVKNGVYSDTIRLRLTAKSGGGGHSSSSGSSSSSSKTDKAPADEQDESKITFADVSPEDWFAPAVEYAAKNGLIVGYHGSFSPMSDLSRGMIAQILYNREGTTAVYTGTYSDVSAADWYAGAVAWVTEQGMMSGYGNGLFGAEDPVTREQLAAILYRYAKAKGYHVDIDENIDLLQYADTQEVGEYAVAAMRWACGEGLLAGRTGGLLDPKGHASRAETAQIFMTFCEEIAR